MKKNIAKTAPALAAPGSEPAEYLRLKVNHPTAQKMQQLWDLAYKLGLSIAFYGHRTIVTDSEFPNRYYDMHDPEDSDDAISEFPPTLGYVLKFENPEFTKWHEEQNRERDAQRGRENSRKKSCC